MGAGSRFAGCQRRKVVAWMNDELRDDVCVLQLLNSIKLKQSNRRHLTFEIEIGRTSCACITIVFCVCSMFMRAAEHVGPFLFDAHFNWFRRHFPFRLKRSIYACVFVGNRNRLSMFFRFIFENSHELSLNPIAWLFYIHFCFHLALNLCSGFLFTYWFRMEFRSSCRSAHVIWININKFALGLMLEFCVHFFLSFFYSIHSQHSEIALCRRWRHHWSPG